MYNNIDLKQPCINVIFILFLDDYIGYVDYGDGNDLKNNTIATEVLVFYAVGIKVAWKHAIAYFFINKLVSSKLKDLVEMAIDKLYCAGVEV